MLSQLAIGVFGISALLYPALAAVPSGWGIGKWGQMVWGERLSAISAIPAMDWIGLALLGGLIAVAGAYATRNRKTGQGITR